jgi:hypothetical protein
MPRGVYDRGEKAETDEAKASGREVNGVFFTDEELAVIAEDAKKAFEAKRRKAALAKALADEEKRLEKEFGLSTLEGDLNEPVTIMVDLPENSDRIMIDQEVIQNGQLITRPRHVINSILEIMWRGQVAQHNLDGKTREEFYRRQRPIAVSPGGAAFTQETVRLS